MEKAILLFTTIVLISFISAQLQTVGMVLAQQNAELYVHLKNTQVLKTKYGFTDADIGALANSIKAIYNTAGTVDTVVTEVLPFENIKGHVQVEFTDESPSHPGAVGTRTGDRTSKVFVQTILDLFKDPKTGKIVNPHPPHNEATATEKVHLLEDTATHESAEVYLEDYDAVSCAHHWVMKSNYNTVTYWDDAQSPDLGFSTVPGGGKDGKRSSDANNLKDRINRDDIIGPDPNGTADEKRHYEDDEVGLIIPSTPQLQPGTTLVCTLFGEEISSPVPGIAMTFTAWIHGYPQDYATHTDSNGMASFDIPLETAKLDVVANYGVPYVMITLEFRVGGFTIPVDKFGLLAPYIGLASTILVATVATAVYVKRVKRRKEKQ
jgi:hypothetical protein